MSQRAHMDWLYIHLSYVNIDVFLPFLLAIGFCVGIISSFLGIGGAWMVTPALNILGFPMPYAIGTDILHVGAKAVIATAQHSKRKNVDYRLGFLMLIGTIIGIELGAQSVMLLEKFHIAGPVLRWIYIVFLTLIALTIFYDQYKIKNNILFYEKLQKIKLRPIVHLKVSNITCSVWLPIGIGLITGFLAGLLGIGGGLFRLPALIYLMGCPTLIAVGTDLFEVMISGCYGGISYALKGRVDFLAASIMFIGAAFGTRIGVLATQYVSDQQIKTRFGLAVFGSLVSIIFKQLNFLLLSKILIFFVVGVLAISIFHTFLSKRSQLNKKGYENGPS